MTPQIAARQADKDAGAAGKSRLTLYGFKDFGYDHSLQNLTSLANYFNRFCCWLPEAATWTNVPKAASVFQNGPIRLQIVELKTRNMTLVTF
jgi:hypothetical protein